jgi:hypothetical protein
LIALRAIVEQEMSVREAERLGELAAQLGGDVPMALTTIAAEQTAQAPRPERSSARPAERSSQTAAQPSPEDEAIQREMSDLLGTPVRLARAQRETRVTITFYDEEKLQEFFDLLNGAR